MIEHNKKLVQNFPEICRYSCSKNNETRNFSLYKEEYFFHFHNINFKFGETVKVECQYCRWNATLPGSFAKKIFKKGLRAETLIRYSKDKLLTSIFLNFFASLWWVFSIVLLFIIMGVIYRFYTQPIILNEPEKIAFSDLKGGKYIGKIVEFSGTVDYPLAFTLDQIQENSNRKSTLISREVYIPVFSADDPTSYVLLRGGTKDTQKVLSMSGISNAELLKNQPYSVIGKVENIDVLRNEELRKYYLEDLPTSRSLTPTNIIISSVGLMPLNQFISQYTGIILLSFAFVFASTFSQIYIDRKIVNKYKS